MQTNNLILIERFCHHHDIDIAFICELQNFGLIEIIVVDENQYLSPEQLLAVEKMIRLHYGLNINIEGIDAIIQLLGRIENLQHELIAAKNRINFFGHVDQ